MATITQLEPASKEDVRVYQPFYSNDKYKVLPYALSLYYQGFLEGTRQIEASDTIAFVASWYVSKLPIELTRCRLQFEGQADFSYEITISNSEFVGYLIDAINIFRQAGSADFPQKFYRKLLRFEE
jgi:hypothetical protein